MCCRDLRLGVEKRDNFFCGSAYFYAAYLQNKKGELTHTHTYAVYTFVYVIASGISFKFNDTHTHAYLCTVCVYINTYTITPRRRK